MVFAAEICLEPFVLLLLVLEIPAIGFAQLAESKAGFADILRVVVVEGRGADSFVLH